MMVWFVDSALDFAFGPVLGLGPFWTVVIVSFVLSLLTVVIYRLATDQEKMRRLHEERCNLNVQLKASRDKPDEALALQKRLMEVSMEHMRHTLKPTLFTFLPIILIFGWLQGHVAFEPLAVDADFKLTVSASGVDEVEIVSGPGIRVMSDSVQRVADGTAVFVLRGVEGAHTVFLKAGDKEVGRSINVGGSLAPAPVVEKYDGSISSSTIDYTPTKVIRLGSFSLGWLGSYIVFSILFSIILRKLFKVY